VLNRDVNVPDKTIAVFHNDITSRLTRERLDSLFQKPNKKRSWFNPQAYHCLPLTIGNQYGFVVKTEFDFEVEWDGGDGPESVHIATFPEQICGVNNCECGQGELKWIDNQYCFSRGQFPKLFTQFGSGILTLIYPFTLRTPPGVNLMTINPPNEVLPNITVLTGVVETDNLRRDFTFNLKIQTPYVKTRFPAGTSLAAVIPVPRYYCDQFTVKMADDLFDDQTVVEELQAIEDTFTSRREVDPYTESGLNKNYFKGEDVYGNNFPDHQKR
jgi:hypothetical protein